MSLFSFISWHLFYIWDLLKQHYYVAYSKVQQHRLLFRHILAEIANWCLYKLYKMTRDNTTFLISWEQWSTYSSSEWCMMKKVIKCFKYFIYYLNKNTKLFNLWRYADLQRKMSLYQSEGIKQHLLWRMSHYQLSEWINFNRIRASHLWPPSMRISSYKLLEIL